MRSSDWSSDVCSSDLCIPYPFTMCNDRFGWFAENDGYAWHRILGRLPCITPAFRTFLGVVDVVLAHTKDVACGPRDWRLQLNCCQRHGDRKSAVKGRSVSVRVDCVGGRVSQKQ